jgi:uncharacterized protein
MSGYRTEATALRPPASLSAAIPTRLRAELSTWSYRAFLLGAMTIVIHLLDDAFVSNAPGTDAADHLVSGGLTTLVAILAMVAWPWLRVASRAVLALSFGILTVGIGLLTHGESLGSGSPSMNDGTGLLMILGGLLLIGLGIVLTHQGIARPVRRGPRWLARRALAVIAALAILNYLFIPIWITAHATYPRQAAAEDMDLGAPYETVTFTTADGLDLAGWFVPSRNGATILALPGASNDRTGVAAQAELLIRRGYGVLLFDPRGMGASEGDPNQFGWHADKDIAAALAWLAGRSDVDQHRIGALGLSMGGEVLLQATAEHPEIRAVVAEGAGSRSLAEVLLTPGIGKWVALPQTWLGYTLTAAISGVAPAPPLDELVARITPRPLLLIYASGSDQTGESQLNPIYFDAAGDPKELWAIPDAGHTQGFATHPAEYEARVIEFFDRALLPAGE